MAKTLNDYMLLPYRLEIIEDQTEGGYVASFPDLPGCITCGETIESTAANALDAKKAWLEAALSDGISIPEPDSLADYSGQFKLRIPRSLHKALAEHSQKEGISMNQYCVYLLSKNDTVEERRWLNNDLHETKSWYLSAVESCLILRGMTRDNALSLMSKYKLKERLDDFPEIQLHYDIETTADEIMAVT